MAAPALTAAGSLAVVALGSAANLIATEKPLESKTWQPRGGFIGVVNGRKSGSTAVVQPPASAPTTPSTPASAPEKKIHPIGGQHNNPKPPSPFGKFPRHRPAKLPGPPKPYDPVNTP